VRRLSTIAYTGAALFAVATTASAQTRGALSKPTRVTIAANGGVHTGAASVSEHFTFDRNQETETVDVTYPTTAGALADVGVSVRAWKNLGIGVAVSRATGNGSADVTATVPHPFLFNQPRTITGTEDGIVHAETAVHLQVQYLLPSSSRVHVVLFAGPSWLNVEQEAVTDVTVTESYPYDTASFGGGVTRIVKRSAPGFHAGFDVSWMFSRSVGVGGLVRYTRADIDFDIATGRSLALKAGGVQAGAGLRLAF
jgi:hypothetical protein